MTRGRRQGPWARVRLIDGSSEGQAWEVTADAAGARVEVGTARQCAWPIHAAGVADYHAEMYWDGQLLWVASAQGVGAEVSIDGQRIEDWQAVRHGATIRLGGATLHVETGGATGEAHTLRRESDAGGSPGAPSGAVPAEGHEELELDAAPIAPTSTRLVGSGGSAVIGGAPAPSEALDPAATRMVDFDSADSDSAIVQRPPPPQIGSASGVARASSASAAPGVPKFAAPPPPTAESRRGTPTEQLLRRLRALPRRTWILVGALAAGLLFLLLTMEDPPQPPPPPPVAQPPIADAGVANTAPVDPPLEPLPEDMNPDKLARLAADAAISGRDEDAFPLYRHLADQHPNDAVYGAIVRMLRKRIQGRCRNGVDPQGRPCR